MAINVVIPLLIPLEENLLNGKYLFKHKLLLFPFAIDSFFFIRLFIPFVVFVDVIVFWTVRTTSVCMIYLFTYFVSSHMRLKSILLQNTHYKNPFSYICLDIRYRH